MPTTEIKKHWDKVAKIGCVITQSDYAVTIHHCHGGSMLYVDGYQNPGVAQKANDWLVIPIIEAYHTGQYGIDNGMAKHNGEKGLVAWERAYGNQVDFLDQVCFELGYNVWHKAGIDREVELCV